jgi:multiple antibiotic resistance protein
MVNPVGSAIEFLSLVGAASIPVYRRLALKIAIDNVLFLLIVEVLGAAILRFFGISIPIVEISGGLVICGIGWATLNEPDAEGISQKEKAGAKSAAEEAEGKYIRKAFYPLTFPLTSGPGTVVTLIAVSAHASRPKPADWLLAHAGIFVAILVISACVYVCYAYAPRLAKTVSPDTIHGIIRIVSFIVFSIGIQIAWNGLSALLHK